MHTDTHNYTRYSFPSCAPARSRSAGTWARASKVQTYMHTHTLSAERECSCVGAAADIWRQQWRGLMCARGVGGRDTCNASMAHDLRALARREHGVATVLRHHLGQHQAPARRSTIALALACRRSRVALRHLCAMRCGHAASASRGVTRVCAQHCAGGHCSGVRREVRVWR